jgi:hypothetical protein
VSGELREVLAKKGKRLVLVEETLLKHSSQRVCYWCHAIRSSGAVFVDTTPTEADKKIDLNNNLTQCFILSVAAGQRQRNRTYCFHLFHEQNGKQIPLWNGYPEQPWNDSQEIKKIILGQVEKLSKASPRGAS